MAERRRIRRVRRSAGEAREQILDAAEKRLGAVGPAGLRLQEIAADVGISHSTIVHHFGGREALVQAVVIRALDGVQRDVIGAFAQEPFDAPDAAALFSHVMRTLADRGHARLLAWLALERQPRDDPSRMLRVLADVMHAHRSAAVASGAPDEDTLFLVILAALTLLSEGLMGHALWHSAGLESDAGAPARFHAWLVNLIKEHMQPVVPPVVPPPAPAPPRARAKRKSR